MKNFFFVPLGFFLVFPVLLPAQTAAEIDVLLNTNALSNEQISSFVLRAADVSYPSSLAGAFERAKENGWLPQKAESGGNASLEVFSLLLMRAFNLKGGLLYSLFKNPHYAYRELVYQQIIQGKTDPDMNVSGDLTLFLVNRILANEETKREEEQRTLLKDIESRLAENIGAQLEDKPDTTVRVTSEGVTISLSNIQFLANSSELPESEKQQVEDIAKILTGIPARRILVSGHTAMAGTPEDRQKTSLERAQAVADYLVVLGARTADEIVIRGYGGERPIADNSTAEGMARNRRVEITILGSNQ